MRKASALCAAMMLVGCVSVPAMDPFGAASDAAMAQADMQQANLMAAQTSAQAGAIRPGDEVLSCDALQAEMTALFNDPAFQATVASMGASAQTQMDNVRAAQAGAVGLGVTSAAVGIASSMIPGMGWLGSAAVQAQQAAALNQMSAGNRARSQMMADATAMMPQVYRGQRIYDLATAKSCAFLNTPGPA